MNASLARCVGFAAVVLLAKLGANVLQQEAPKAPERAAELLWLDQLAGEYDADVEFMGKTTPGSYVSKMGCGGYWLIDDFKGEVMGQPYVGHGMTGYDPIKKKIVAVWGDSSPTPLTTMEGTLAADKKSMVLDGIGIDMEGKPAKSRHVMTVVDKKTLKYTIAMVGADGKETQTLAITYKRK